MPADPYQTLGVRRSASDAEIRRAYRRLVQLHHPDHNNGSPESETRFEEVQDANARSVEERKLLRRRAPQPPPPDPDVEARLSDIEEQVRRATAARERARRAAREAAATTDARRASDEELGYVTTDDSLSKILADARQEISDWFGAAREQPATQRVADMLEDLADKLRREKR